MRPLPCAHARVFAWWAGCMGQERVRTAFAAAHPQWHGVPVLTQLVPRLASVTRARSTPPLPHAPPYHATGFCTLGRTARPSGLPCPAHGPVVNCLIVIVDTDRSEMQTVEHETNAGQSVCVVMRRFVALHNWRKRHLCKGFFSRSNILCVCWSNTQHAHSDL